MARSWASAASSSSLSVATNCERAGEAAVVSSHSRSRLLPLPPLCAGIWWTSGRPGLLKTPCLLGRPNTKSGPTSRAWAVGQARWTSAARPGGPTGPFVPCRASPLLIYICFDIYYLLYQAVLGMGPCRTGPLPIYICLPT
jgi:hypothetical protein